MAKSGVTIEVEGLGKLIKKLGAIPENVKREVDAEMAAAANTFVNGAVNDAPVDQGLLKSQITFERLDVMYYEVVSGADYSAFIEFGTRNKVQVPAELAAYAAQFRSGGGGGDVKKQIFDWCRRQGIDEKMWFPIYRSIMTNGIKAHPFFFPQLPLAQSALNNNLKQVVARALK